MKFFIFSILFCSPLFAFAQEMTLPVDSATQKVSYSEVVQAPGLTKDDLYIRGREWFAKTFVSAQSVIQMDDKQAGKIIGKGVEVSYKTVILSTYRFTIFYTVSLTVKDGRYRYEIGDFYSQDDPSKYIANPSKYAIDEWATSPKYRKKDGDYKSSVKKELLTVNTIARALSSSLKSSLSAAPTGIKSKDDF